MFLASRGAVFQLDEDGRFIALPTPTGQPVFGVTSEHLTVFGAFAQPSTIPEARARLSAQHTMAPVDRLIDDLMTWGLLTVESTERGDEEGFGHIEAHLPMVADTRRVRAYAEAIRAHAPEQTVAELGCGTGILSLLAAEAGAQWVWAVEESDIATVAEAVLHAHRQRGTAWVERANSFDVTPPEPVDVLIHELFGMDPLDENILRIIDDARKRWLKPGGRLLPMAFSIRACAVGGPQWNRGWEFRQRVRALADDLGIDLDPVLRASGRAPIRRIDPPTIQPTAQECLTEPITLLHVDLQTAASQPARSEHVARVRNAGTVGAILVWFEIQLDETRSLAASPFSEPTHWQWQVWDLPETIPVSTDCSLELRVELRTTEGCPHVEVVDVRLSHLEVGVAEPGGPEA